jgi:hypothetical protein
MMDTIETLVILGALLAALALGGPRIEAIQQHADSRYPQLQAASAPVAVDCVGLELDEVCMQESRAR